MAESLRIRNVITNPRSTLAILLMAGVAIAGCGNTKSADKTPLGACGSHDYSKAGVPVRNKAEIMATAEQDVLALQALALRVGGSIDLPRYGGTSGDDNDVEEITASGDNLRLNFDRTGWISASNRVDHVDFPVTDGQVFMGDGSVMCYDDARKLVTNGTYVSLQSYVHETAALGQ